VNFNAYAELSANFPDEAIQGEDGEMIDLGARTAAEAIGEILRGAGYDIAPPEFMGDHGWDLNVYVDRKRIWLEFQPGAEPQEYILQIEAMAGFFRRLRGIDLTYYAEFLTKLNEGVGRDPRFRWIKWYELKNHSPTGDPSDEPLKVMDWRG